MPMELPLEAMLAYLEEHSPPPETRPEATTEGLVARYPRLADVEVDPVTIHGPHGAVEARRYVGPDRTGVGLVWFHGGAFVGGTLDMPEAHWVALTIAAAGVPVVSADYRKALNGVHHPVLSDDVLAAFLAAPEHLDGVDRLHLGGASAGANLAAGVTKRLRDGAGPPPAGLVLAYPLLHAELPPLSDELAAAVRSAGDDVGLFDQQSIRLINLNHVGDAGSFSDEYAFPANGDLSGLPPTLIVNSEYDTLRASGEAFGAALAAAGVPVSLVCEPGAAHGHLDQPLAAHGQRTLDRMIAWLRQ